MKLFLYRVVVRFRFRRLPFLIERGCIAPDRETAIRDVCAAQQTDKAEPGSLQVLIEPIFDISQFDADALYSPCINGDGDTIAEIWKRMQAKATRAG